MFETERLSIIPLNAKELRKSVYSQKELEEELKFVIPKTLFNEETRNVIINDLLPHIEKPEKNPLFYIMWLIVEKSTSTVAGSLCFYGEPNSDSEVEIGYGTDIHFQNRGIMTEAIGGLINWLKTNTKEIKAINARTEKSNITSIKVLEKNGFKLTDIQEEIITLTLNIQ